MSATKNSQTFEDIKRISAKAFPERTVKNADELDGGLCNSVYLVTFEDNSTAILKVASATTEGYLRNEKNLMDVEVQSLRFVENNTKIIAPKIYFYDTERNACTGNYFFMETMNGNNFLKMQSELSNNEKSDIYNELGRAVRVMEEVKGENFCIFGQRSYDTLYEFICSLFRNMLCDAEPFWDELKLCYTADEIFRKLANDKPCFDEVTTPDLVHMDLWDGNVFIKDNHISGIIDWERTMWADTLFCEQFRRYMMNKDFLAGYGKSRFSESEKRRIAWYDVYLFSTMLVEVFYRKYENFNAEWVRPLLEEAWNEICEL